MLRGIYSFSRNIINESRSSGGNSGVCEGPRAIPKKEWQNNLAAEKRNERLWPCGRACRSKGGGGLAGAQASGAVTGDWKRLQVESVYR